MKNPTAQTDSSRLSPIPRRLAARRPTAHYATLAVLFVVAVAYQLRALEYRFPRWFRVSHVAWPFLLDAEDQPHFFLLYVRPNAQQAGLRDGDTLLAVNGRPVSGRAVLADALATARQGDVMKVMTLSKGTGTGLAERTVSVRLVSPTEPDSPVEVLLIVIMPALCLVLGFWVAAVRPRDVRAWLLLALMLSLASFFNSFPEFWGPKARWLGTLYYSFQQNSWLGWLFLLGVYFPEPFPAGARWRWWKWLQWVALPAWMVLVTAYAAAAVGELHSVAAVIRINRFIGRMHGPEVILGACLVGGFLACTVAKYRLAPSADSKRRLRVLYAGAGVSLLPLTVLSTIAQLHHVSPEQYFPLWLMIVAYVCFSLLPVTLAYVIVVQRAMDVRLVIRQGLKYSVAKNTVNALKTALAAVIGAGLYYSIYDWSRGRNSLFPYLTLAIGVALFAGLNPLLESLGAWTDRRFFRDAYNAEQILGELAEKVRTIVETESLLETVTQRIADALHVPRLAVLLDGSAPYQPAYALGFGNLPDVAFPEGGATVQALKKEKQPLRIYFDDPNSWVYHSSEVSDSEREMLMHLRAELLLPFAVKDRLIGFMSLGPKLSEAPYSGGDVRLLTSVATQTALALEVARLTTAIGNEIAQRERLNRELEIAREVQEHLFPQRPPSVLGLDYCGRCRPAREVGGDYYDFLELPNGRLGIAIGDVSGKGIGAALMMASLQASLRGQVSVEPHLAELMKRVNSLVYEASSANSYATFFYAEYDSRSRQLSYVNGGHNPPAVLRKSAAACQVFRLETGGPVIGLLRQGSYRQGSFPLEPGDLVVLFTDGISESMNDRNEEWGEHRLIDFARTCQGLSASETLTRIMAGAEEFAAGAPQHDDMTLVVLRVLVSQPT